MATKAKGRQSRRSDGLTPITSVGQLKPGLKIEAHYKGETIKATVGPDGQIKMAGRGTQPSIGAAGRAITGKWSPTLSKGRFWYQTR